MARLFLHILRVFIDVPWVKLLLMYTLQLLKLYVGCCEGSAGHPQKGISDVPKGTMGIALVESCSGCLLRSVLVFRWSSKSVSAYSQRLCSFLCPVIAVILSFDTPFCSFLTVVFRTLWLVNRLLVALSPAHFAISFIYPLMVSTPTGCDENHVADMGEIFLGGRK